MRVHLNCLLAITLSLILSIELYSQVVIPYLDYTVAIKLTEIVSVEDQLSDFDLFFYYGHSDLNIETKHDVMLNVIQSKRSLFYSRSLDSAGVPNYENYPKGLMLQVLLPYDIVISLSKRNNYVSNGQNGYPDRRIALSQSTIRLEEDKNSNGVNVTVLYRPMSDIRISEIVSSPLGQTK